MYKGIDIIYENKVEVCARKILLYTRLPLLYTFYLPVSNTSRYLIMFADIIPSI